jgi:3',5'-cyclic AMP phosphodiesterase CpdA
MFRLGHISDVHLAPVPTPRRRQLMSKRIIGYSNWRKNREKAMTSESLDRLVADMRAQKPDHIAVTGDLTNIALREEFENAQRWLEALGTPDRVTAIPGNHDAYVPGAHLRYAALWAPWMAGDEAARADTSLFPFLRRKGHVALIGVSSAVASAPFMATGRVGRGQTERLTAVLAQAGGEGLFRIVLIHHPPKLIDASRALRRLTDGKRFRYAVRSAGAELVLHGHEHVRCMTSIRGPMGEVPVVGVPAGSGPATGGPEAGGYALHEIERDEEGWRLTVIHRGYDGSGEIVETARRTYSVSRP